MLIRDRGVPAGSVLMLTMPVVKQQRVSRRRMDNGLFRQVLITWIGLAISVQDEVIAYHGPTKALEELGLIMLVDALVT